MKKIETLTPREKRVLEARMSGKTIEEVAKYEDVTRERIRQIEKKAIIKFATGDSLTNLFPLNLDGTIP